MSSDPLENASDYELRRLLLENGFPNLPVTETTRNVIIKKLRNYFYTKEDHSRRNRQTTCNVPRATATQQIGSVRGVEVSQMQKRRTVVNGTYNVSTETAQTPTATPGTYVSRLMSETTCFPYVMEQRHYSRANLHTDPLPVVAPVSAAPILATQSSPTGYSRTAKMYAPPPILDSDSGEDSDYLNYMDHNAYVRKQQLYPNNNNSTHKATAGKISSSEAGKMKHFGVVSRLLSLRDRTIPATRMQSGYQLTTPPKESVVTPPNMHYQHLTPIMGGVMGATRSKQEIRNREEHTPATSLSYCTQLLQRWLHASSVYKQQIFVPYALIALFLAFLVVLAFMYIILSPDMPNAINENSTNFVLCSGNGAGQPMTTSSGACIESNHLADTLVLGRELIGMLQDRAEKQNCQNNQLNGGNSDSKIKSVAVLAHDFVQHHQLQQRKGIAGVVVMDTSSLLRRLSDLKYLISLNPKWGVAVSNSKQPLPGGGFTYETQFVLQKPRLPFMCALYAKIQRFFVIIGTGTVMVAVCLVIYLTFRYWYGWHNERLVAVDNFTKEILDELLYRASLYNSNGKSPDDSTDSTDSGVVIVNHLRDKLLPLRKRNSLLWSWNQALRLLEANDSRVQFGVCLRNGEEFRTIQWIGHTTDESIGSGSPARNKQWQSPAFDKVNKVAVPPTPCLKIRHMFDASEVDNPQLKRIIKDAIIHKVGPTCKICDVQIDKQSCCVYVRCASEADAGIIHNNINGWWFDSRLVSIKFLRLQRYLCRFPKSTGTDMP